MLRTSQTVSPFDISRINQRLLYFFNVHAAATVTKGTLTFDNL